MGPTRPRTRRSNGRANRRHGSSPGAWRQTGRALHAQAGWPAEVAQLGPHSSAMRIPLVILLTTVVTLAGCSRAPVITIANLSPVTLSNLVISGSGFSDR